MVDATLDWSLLAGVWNPRVFGDVDSRTARPSRAALESHLWRGRGSGLGNDHKLEGVSINLEFHHVLVEGELDWRV
jgi:hypothetical protein